MCHSFPSFYLYLSLLHTLYASLSLTLPLGLPAFFWRRVGCVLTFLQNAQQFALPVPVVTFVGLWAPDKTQVQAADTDTDTYV